VTVRRWLIGIVACAVVAAACSSDETSPTSDAADPGSDPVSTALPVALEPDPPPDLSGVSFVDNLLAREADREWTRGEGLTATLRLALGEAEADDVLRTPELVERELTGIVAMAREYLADGSDPTTKEEIGSLLDRLVFSPERLEAMAGIGPETAGLDDTVAASALQEAQQDCLEFFPKEASILADGIGACLQVREVVALDGGGDGPFRIFMPVEELGSGGWQEKHYQLAAEAVAESIDVLSRLEGSDLPFEIPPLNVVFSVTEGIASALADPTAGGPCGIALFTEMLKPAYSDADFQQIVAHEIAHCFQTERFPEQNSVSLEYTRWREEGVADLLSNVVYPDNDLEWNSGRMAKLAEAELRTSLFERAYSNSIFFQHVLSTSGVDALFNLIDNLPTKPGLQAQKDAMLAYPGMVEKHQEFAQTLTDEMIVDSSGAFGEYPMTAQNFPKIEVTSPGTIVDANLEPFQLTRAHIVVPPGKQACLTWDDSNYLVRKRDHPVGSNAPAWEALPLLLPPSLEESGNVALAVTARSPGSFGILVSSVHDLNEEHDGELAGTWVVQNASLADKVDYLAPVQDVTSTSGRITVTFRDDGTVHMAYDGFTVSGSSDVKLEDGAFSSDFSKTYTSVTNAEGTDTYELAPSGEYVFYGELSESAFLRGTETVSETFQGVFIGIKTDDIELGAREPEESVNEYDPTGWAILGAANKVRFACGGEILLLDDIVLRRDG
jgi:hypothetical protein